MIEKVVTPQNENLASQDFDPEESFQTTYFYTTTTSLSRENGSLEMLERNGLKVIKPLTYKDDNDPSKFSTYHMFLCERQGQKVKARFCYSLRDALRIEQNVRFATGRGVNTPSIISRDDSLLVLEFVEGVNATELTIEQCKAMGELYARMLRPFPDFESKVRGSLQRLFEECLESLLPVLSTDQINHLRSLANTLTPSKIIPVFDHQDAGRHNTIIDKKSNPWLIDEEAFGILPFGYTQERLLHGLSGSGTFDTDEQRSAYLDQLPEDFRSLYLETRPFWEFVLRLRTAGRHRFLNNPKALSNIDMYLA